jgi:cellulose synthase/poly-beta-1,6-N-acetylglucosamine synthase-like glycosyltransferase
MPAGRTAEHVYDGAREGMPLAGASRGGGRVGHARRTIIVADGSSEATAMTEQPFVSVVVSTRDRVAELDRCLSGLERLDYPAYEVIVVDNTSGDQDVRRLAEAAGARLVVEPTVGLSGARNTGARTARGELIAFIDDDAVARPSWLAAHAAAFRDSAVAATTGRILALSPTTAASRTWAEAQDLGDAAFRVDRTSPHWFERANFGGLGSGSNLVLRAALFMRWGGFRESLGLGERERPLGEEHYAFFTLIREGHAVAYLPDAVVYHEPPASVSELRLKKRRLVRGSAAYLVMLLLEHPEFRARTLRYVLTALRGERRTWRTGGLDGPFLSRGQLAAAALAAPWLYWRSRSASAGARTR